MSALFEREIGLISQSVEIERNLELCQIPHLRQISTSYPPRTHRSWGLDYVEDMLSELYGNLSTKRMYSAIIDASLNGLSPSWTKNDWSFTPLNLSTLTSIQSVQDGDASELGGAAMLNSPVNLTMTTPAIRGRLECTPFPEVSNTSTWLEKYNATEFPIPGSRGNASTLYLLSDYEVMGSASAAPLPPGGGVCVSCCFNQTDAEQINDYAMPVAVGYWTQAVSAEIDTLSGWNGNLTAKWIHGSGGFAPLQSGVDKKLFFLEPQKQQFLNCMPIIEIAEAQVTVEKETGRVLEYSMLSATEPTETAWYVT
jgi:hypothetical protein